MSTRRLSPFDCYWKRERAALRVQHPGLLYDALQKRARLVWADLTAAQRQPYITESISTRRWAKLNAQTLRDERIARRLQDEASDSSEHVAFAQRLPDGNRRILVPDASSDDVLPYFLVDSEEEEEEEAPPPRARSPSPPPVVVGDPSMCAICFGPAPTHAALPCGHKYACGKCAAITNDTSKTCAICRSPINSFLRIIDAGAIM
jgi:hypothetical protein